MDPNGLRNDPKNSWKLLKGFTHPTTTRSNSAIDFDTDSKKIANGFNKKINTHPDPEESQIPTNLHPDLLESQTETPQ